MRTCQLVLVTCLGVGGLLHAQESTGQPKQESKEQAAKTLPNGARTYRVGMSGRTQAKMGSFVCDFGDPVPAEAQIKDPESANHMAILHAKSLDDAIRRAKMCRSDVGQVKMAEHTYAYICRPYLVCDTPEDLKRTEKKDGKASSNRK